MHDTLIGVLRGRNFIGEEGDTHGARAVAEEDKCIAYSIISTAYRQSSPRWQVLVDCPVHAADPTSVTGILGTPDTNQGADHDHQTSRATDIGSPGPGDPSIGSGRAVQSDMGGDGPVPGAQLSPDEDQERS